MLPCTYGSMVCSWINEMNSLEWNFASCHQVLILVSSFCSFVSAQKKAWSTPHQPSTCLTLIQTYTRPSALRFTNRILPWPPQHRPRVAESCRLILQQHLFFSILSPPPNGTKYIIASGPCGHFRWTLHVTTSTYSSNPSWARVYCPIHPRVPDQPQRTPVLYTIAKYPSHALREFRLVARWMWWKRWMVPQQPCRTSTRRIWRRSKHTCSASKSLDVLFWCSCAHHFPLHNTKVISRPTSVSVCH